MTKKCFVVSITRMQDAFVLERRHLFLNLHANTYGQLISELIFGVFNFPKKQRRNLKDFCTRFQKVIKSKR